MKTKKPSTSVRLNAGDIIDLIFQIRGASGTFGSYNVPCQWTLGMVKSKKFSLEFGAKVAVQCVINLSDDNMEQCLVSCLGPDEIDAYLSEKKASQFKTELAQELKRKLNKGQLDEIKRYLNSIE